MSLGTLIYELWNAHAHFLPHVGHRWLLNVHMQCTVFHSLCTWTVIPEHNNLTFLSVTDTCTCTRTNVRIIVRMQTGLGCLALMHSYVGTGYQTAFLPHLCTYILHFASLYLSGEPFYQVINPRRACAARVTVLALCVCVSVWYRSSSYSVCFNLQPTASTAFI